MEEGPVTAPVAARSSASVERKDVRFLWLDLTRKCQLKCEHCLNESSPEGDHGEMTREDWVRVLNEGAASGVRAVQLFGGEPMLHPNALELVERALDHGMKIEVYSNLVHVSNAWWGILQCRDVSLATSYYSDVPEEHNKITGRKSHGRTKSNIAEAIRLGIPVRVGIIDCGGGQRVEEARRELIALGVKNIKTDHVRPYGRAACGQKQNAEGLCGRCGDGRAAVGPDGNVSPCVFSTWLSVGNVLDSSLEDVLVGDAMIAAGVLIRSNVRMGDNGDDDDDDDNDDECTPGFPGSECTPRN
ncbi:radical SAM/SPASM domain-containing protein [Streptomyces sp. NPDC020607]|uniref:radical SAM/SPASM domain-containing protein n=1 Tax=Streptomyces sp. NPDC020607 TaxID=3365082 RepID=UPI00378B41AA